MTQLSARGRGDVSGDVYQGLVPIGLWEHFATLNSIPRPSKHETEALSYVALIAERAGMPFCMDAAGNAVVKVSASNGAGTMPVVALQAHLDMVCVARPGVTHDFYVDPIRPLRNGDCICADGTTLGADNGIGVAACLALLTGGGIIQHGPLELIFTVEEESGLQGASSLALPLQAKYLINLDSEDPTEITVGSAGGVSFRIDADVGFEVVDPASEVRDIKVFGLRGGHSGLDIGHVHGNAIKILASILQEVEGVYPEYVLCSLEGGSARNALASWATASVAFSIDRADLIVNRIRDIADGEVAELSGAEPGLRIEVSPGVVTSSAGFMRSDRNRVVQMLTGLPHGVIARSSLFPGKVDTSCNLAQVKMADRSVEVVMTGRSLRSEGLDIVRSEIARVSEAADARASVVSEYPCWTPEIPSPLLDLVARSYQDVYDRSPSIQVVHAGLECGLLVQKVKGMHAVSIGPRIVAAHTPDEYVTPSSVEAMWNFLVSVLGAIARGQLSS